jgi:type I restriction enzyme S subunit
LSGLLEGLEVAIIPLSSVQAENSKVRIDSGFFTKAALLAESLVEDLPNDPLGDLTSTFRKGIFDIKADTYVDPGEGVPFIRITDIKTGTIQKQSTAWIDHAAHEQEAKTALRFGDLVLSKTAYPAAAMVNLPECNVSQDTIAVRLSPDGQRQYRMGYVAAYLNSVQGLALMARRFQGNVQQHLSLEDGKSIRVPRFDSRFQDRVHALILRVNHDQDAITQAMAAAEQTCLSALGLADWTPPEPLAYTARSADVLASGRFDARFYAPRIQALLDVLSVDGRTVSDVAIPRRERFRPDGSAAFDYIEIGDIDGAGAAASTHLASEDAPSRATWRVRSDDIITSTVRPIRRLSAQIAPEQEGFVCSSGFVVLRPYDIAAEVLLTYLRLPVVCELLDLYASASMYPAIADADILNLPLPRLLDKVTARVKQSVIAAKAAKVSATNRLEAAKRAVEIAILDGEPAAMAYLDEAEGTI